MRRRDGVKSLTTPEEGAFKVPIGCIRDKIMASSALIRKLVGTGWGASPSVLRTSALACSVPQHGVKADTPAY